MPGVIVEENTLQVQISGLRKALGVIAMLSKRSAVAVIGSQPKSPRQARKQRMNRSTRSWQQAPRVD